MAAPKVPEAKLSRAVEIVNEVYAAGYQPGAEGTLAEAAERCVREGLFSATPMLWPWLARARQRLDLTPDETLFRPRVYQHASPVQPVPPSQDHTVAPMPHGEPEYVIVIGDAHDSPHLPDKSRFTWLGRFIAERRPKRVISMGDWWTLDSMSSHTDPASFEGLGKPSFEQDMESFHKSQQAFREGLGDFRPMLDVVLGNHEFRAWRWANAHREILGGKTDPALALLEAYHQWGWRTTPYGEFRFFSGVGFIHAPLIPGTAGKTYGGKTGGQRAANDAMFDIVRGDDHKFYVASAPKIGPVKSPRVFGTATALPPGYIETYARKNPGDWESGICELTIWNGRVMAFAFTDMQILRHRYAA